MTGNWQHNLPYARQGPPLQQEIPAGAGTRPFVWWIFMIAIMIGFAPTLFTFVLPFYADSDMSSTLEVPWLLMNFMGLPVWGLLLVIVGVIALCLRRQPAFMEIAWGCVASLILILVQYAWLILWVMHGLY